MGKQKQAIAEQEKKIKKLKGAMKAAAQDELEAMEAKHAEELKAFDAGPAPAAESTADREEEEEEEGEKKKKKKKKDKKEDKEEEEEKEEEKKEEEPPSKKAPKKQVFRERNWNGCSKTELEEECVERGLSKKGKKEDLIMRLIDFHNEQKLNAEDEEEAEDSEED